MYVKCIIDCKRGKHERVRGKLLLIVPTYIMARADGREPGCITLKAFLSASTSCHRGNLLVMTTDLHVLIYRRYLVSPCPKLYQEGTTRSHVHGREKADYRD